MACASGCRGRRGSRTGCHPCRRGRRSGSSRPCPSPRGVTRRWRRGGRRCGPRRAPRAPPPTPPPPSPPPPAGRGRARCPPAASRRRPRRPPPARSGGRRPGRGEDDGRRGGGSRSYGWRGARTGSRRGERSRRRRGRPRPRPGPRRSSPARRDRPPARPGRSCRADMFSHRPILVPGRRRRPEGTGPPPRAGGDRPRQRPRGADRRGLGLWALPPRWKTFSTSSWRRRTPRNGKGDRRWPSLQVGRRATSMSSTATSIRTRTRPTPGCATIGPSIGMTPTSSGSWPARRHLLRVDAPRPLLLRPGYPASSVGRPVHRRPRRRAPCPPAPTAQPGLLAPGDPRHGAPGPRGRDRSARRHRRSRLRLRD